MNPFAWISYPLLLVLLFSNDRVWAEEKERLRIDISLSEFVLDRDNPKIAVEQSKILLINPRSSVVVPIAEAILPLISPNSQPKSISKSVQSSYLIPPKILKLEEVNPRTTKIHINGIQTIHQSQSDFVMGIESGSNRHSTTSLNAIKLFAPKVEDSISRDRVYRIEYTNAYNQIQTVRRHRDISTVIVTPQTILGLRKQISLIGDCLPTNQDNSDTTSVKRQCTYIPGIFTDNTSIKPDLLLPARMISGASFGEVISPESLAIIRQPGFQAGANGQKFGVDLYFPRVGATDGNNTNSRPRVERDEQQFNTPAVTIGNIKQVLVSNGEQSGISRTIRGLTAILDDRYPVVNSGFQLLGTALPDAEPQLVPGKSGRSVTMNPNLILAANNTRFPENSLTAYSAGWGYADTASDLKAGIPAPVHYHAVWMGLSPVIDRQAVNSSSYRTTGAERIKVYSGGEGGAQSSVSAVVGINDRQFSSTNIGNAYSQVYLTLFDRDVDRLNTTKLQENTDYYPHLSLTGNITTYNSVFRYYTGAMMARGVESRQAGSSVRAYGGVDFNQTTPGGFSYDLAAVGYINPDPEYYSRISVNTNQKISLGQNPAYNLVLNASLNYAIDGTTEFDKLKFRSGNSSLSTGVALNLGDVSVGTTYFMPNGMPNSIDSLLSTNLTWRIKDNIAVSGYYTPINRNSPQSPYGINASFKFGKEYYSPSLNLGWSRNDTSFGQSAAGDRFSSSDNVVGVFFRFGESLNSRKLN
jgi:hypothetical protein